MEKGVDSTQSPLTEVASFIYGLQAVQHKGRPLAAATIAGYRSAIPAIHQGFPDGSTVSPNADLSTLLQGKYILSTEPRILRETWDLPMMLKHLEGARL